MPKNAHTTAQLHHHTDLQNNLHTTPNWHPAQKGLSVALCSLGTQFSLLHTSQSLGLLPASCVKEFIALDCKKNSQVSLDVGLGVRCLKVVSSGCCSVTKLCLTLCDPVDCSLPGSPLLHYLLELAQTHVH